MVLMNNQTCNNCACDSVCDHNWNGWETCGNWQPILVRCKDCENWNKDALACNTLPWVASSEHVNWYENDFCSYGEQRDDHEAD